MKTLPLYWLNQLYKKFVFLSFLLISFSGWAQYEPSTATLGVIESTEEIIKIHRSSFLQLYKKTSKNPKQLLQKYKESNVKIHPIFFQSLLLYSAQKYVNLLSSNKCHLYSLLQAGLLKTARGKVDNIIIQLRTNQINKFEDAQTTLNDYIRLKTRFNCQNTIEISQLFSVNNLSSTMKMMTFPIPKTQENCLQVLNDWKINLYTPHLCGIKERIKRGKRAKRRKQLLKGRENLSKTRKENNIIRGYEKIKNSTSLYQRSYIDSLCKNLDDTHAYCSLYLSSLVWDKIINAEKPEYLMSYLCNDYFPDKKRGSNFIQYCRNELIKNPKLCYNTFDKTNGSFFPHPDCSSISNALNNSRLKTDYDDCPARIDNEAITNYHRLINHFSKTKKENVPTKQCQDHAIESFAKMNIDFENEVAWPMKLCFHDKFEDKEACKTYIPGSNDIEPLSETNVVSSIINKQLSLNARVKCKLVPDNKYRPQFLEYKSGCFIVYEQNNCTLLNCKKKIIIDKKPNDLIKYKGHPKFEYVASSFANEKFAQNNVLKETYKLSEKKILNLTMLKSFFSVKNEGIIHGVGCIEDLMPRFFKRERLQACTPHPFIIDASIDKGLDTFLIFRSSIDSIHLPRQVRWHSIFNAVSNFREIHPLRKWILIGLTYEKN